MTYTVVLTARLMNRALGKQVTPALRFVIMVKDATPYIGQ